MRSQDTILRQPQTPAKLFFSHLASLMIGEESRKHTVANSPFRHAGSNLRDYAAHIGAWHNGGILFGGFVVFVLALGHFELISIDDAGYLQGIFLADIPSTSR